MNRHKRIRWRFSLRSMIVAVFLISMICAATLTNQERQLMWKFSEADGGGAMYGSSFGWPMTYLRVPVGEYAHVPADLFVPGLIADLALAALLVATVIFAWKTISRVILERKPNAA